MDDETTPAATALAQRATAGPSRRQPFIALAAAVLIIALGVTLFGVYGARLRVGGSSTATGGGACAPGKATARIPANGQLHSVAMVSATDGWAVGGIFKTQTYGSPPLTSRTEAAKSLMMRYQHCAWSVAGQGIPSADLYNVTMTSASDGWALGATDFPTGSVSTVDLQLLLLHYTGGAWQRVNLDERHGFQGGILRMFSKDDGWLMLMYGSAQLPTLYHYQGSQWTPVALPAQLSGASINVMSSHASGEVWFAGALARTSDRTFIARYSAGQWQVWDTSTAGGLNPAGSAIGFVSAIQIVSPHDVWAFGTYATPVSGVENALPYILHFDGARWTPIPVVSPGALPTVVFWTAVVPQPNGRLLALGAMNPSAGMTAAAAATFQRIVALRCSTQSCQPRTFPLTGVDAVESVSLSTSTQGFALAFAPNEPLKDGLPPTSVLLAYNAGDWTRVPA